MIKKIIISTLFISALFSHEIIVATTVNWEPFNMTQNNRVEGIGIDFWKLVAKKARLKYKIKICNYWSGVLNSIKNKTATLTVSTEETCDRKNYALFSKPYVSYPLVIATKNNVGFIFDMAYLKNKKIAVGRDYTAAVLMKKKFPHLHYIYCDNINDALEMVKESKAFAAVDILPVIAYKINKYEYNGLKISGSVPIKFNVRFMLAKGNKKLLSVINKTIDKITPEEKIAIYNKYIKPKKQLFTFTPGDIVFYILIVLCMIIILFVWGYNFKNELKMHKEKKLNEDFQKNCDKLTGIIKKEKLKEEIDKYIKAHKPFSLIMFDIDGFKNINRFYGHHFGDITLLELVSVVKSALEDNDLLVRYNGGTFVVLIDETEIAACEKAKKIFDLINNFEFSIVKNLECTFLVSSFLEPYNADLLKIAYSKLRTVKRKNLKFIC